MNGIETIDEIKFTALGIGHGDAILTQVQSQGQVWTCLVDGGKSKKGLIEALGEAGITSIDLLILSHLDSDHIDGLLGLFEKDNQIKLSSYLGPCLPAFERHLWLFGERGRKSIERGKILEKAIKESKTDIYYPLEGYSSIPIERNIKVSVLSPPTRLIKRLLTEDDVSALFSEYPMPLTWLLEPEPDIPYEQTEFMINLDASLARSGLTSEDLEDLHPPTRYPDIDAGDMASEWAERTGLEPEFFGDSTLNNTSLVLYMEFNIGNNIYRILLPGDQENWTYLFARNPRGLKADILKASHHGGRVYKESDLAHNELFYSVQPLAVVLSANGTHKLPRNTVRHAATQWGASIFCTSKRMREIITGKVRTKICCHKEYGCDSSRSISLIMDKNGMKCLEPACHSGYGRAPGPVIQVSHDIVPRSNVLIHLVEHELRRHIDWVRDHLTRIHEERRRTTEELITDSETVSEDQIKYIARKENRWSIIPHLEEILEQGANRGKFWAYPSDRYRRSNWQAYCGPSEKEVRLFIKCLKGKAMVLFSKRLDNFHIDRDTLFYNLELSGIAEYAKAVLGLPSEAFRDALWPAVTKAFSGKQWHCYAHGSGMLAFSTAGSVQLLSEALLESFLSKNYQGEQTIRIMSDLFPFGGPVLVSGKSDRGQPMETYSQAKVVDRWMELNRKDCAVEDWKKMCDSGLVKMERGSFRSDHMIWDLFFKSTKGNIKRMAGWYQYTVAKWW